MHSLFFPLIWISCWLKRTPGGQFRPLWESSHYTNYVPLLLHQQLIPLSSEDDCPKSNNRSLAKLYAYNIIREMRFWPNCLHAIRKIHNCQVFAFLSTHSCRCSHNVTPLDCDVIEWCQNIDSKAHKGRKDLCTPSIKVDLLMINFSNNITDLCPWGGLCSANASETTFPNPFFEIYLWTILLSHFLCNRCIMRITKWGFLILFLNRWIFLVNLII